MVSWVLMKEVGMETWPCPFEHPFKGKTTKKKTVTILTFVCDAETEILQHLLIWPDFISWRCGCVSCSQQAGSRLPAHLHPLPSLSKPRPSKYAEVYYCQGHLKTGKGAVENAAGLTSKPIRSWLQRTANNGSAKFLALLIDLISSGWNINQGCTMHNGSWLRWRW